MRGKQLPPALPIVLQLQSTTPPEICVHLFQYIVNAVHQEVEVLQILAAGSETLVSLYKQNLGSAARAFLHLCWHSMK